MILASLFSYNLASINVILPVRVHSAGGYLFKASGCWLATGFGEKTTGLGSAVAVGVGTGVLSLSSPTFCFDKPKNQTKLTPTTKTTAKIIVCFLAIL